MKKIITLFPILLAFGVFGQDSSNTKIDGIILKGKDCDLIARVIKFAPSQYFRIDSVLKAIYVNPPGNNADVTINGIPGKEWLRMLRILSFDRVALIQNCYSRVKAELLLHGGSWITNKITNDDLVLDSEYDSYKKEGQKYAKKTDDENTN